MARPFETISALRHFWRRAAGRAARCARRGGRRAQDRRRRGRAARWRCCSQHDIALWLRADPLRPAPARRGSVTLADGSRVELDARSAHRRAFRARRAARRRCSRARPGSRSRPIRRGPSSSRRPGGTVTALGTAFDVALDERRGARVTVGEHQRARSRAAAATSSSRRASRAPMRPARRRRGAAAGRCRARHRLAARQADLRERAARRGGARRSAAIIAAMSFSSIPRLKARRVTGVFSADDPLAALDEIETSLGLRCDACHQISDRSSTN